MKKFFSLNEPCLKDSIVKTSDIIKAHGGEIKVETKEGERAEFVIELSVSINA